MAVAFIALGSNLNNPLEQVELAMVALSKLPNVQVIKQSSLYSSAPVGYNNQPDFINAVVQVETSLAPEALLAEMFTVENDFGRVRPFPNAPRLLDLDLLLYDTVKQNTAFLTLPHPRMLSRAFVMLPLAEVAPDLMLEDGRLVVELAEAVKEQAIKKLSKRK
jgi:2-amino-4-hydroxy-6-hydroxymethyldihydropteridine diphosphokinase